MIAKIFASVSVFAAFCVRASAEVVDPTVFWERLVAEKPLAEIAAMMGAKEHPRWPTVGSINLVGAQSSGRGQSPATTASAVKGVELVKALHVKVRHDFDKGPAGSAEQMIYCKLASELQDADGYSNFLLADSLNRLAILCISGWLVSGTVPEEHVTASLKHLKVPNVNVRLLLQKFALDDDRVKARLEDVAKIKATDNLYAAMERIGLDVHGIVGDAMLPKNQSFTRLLEVPLRGRLDRSISGNRAAEECEFRRFSHLRRKGRRTFRA